jgi:hypothetical protein
MPLSEDFNENGRENPEPDCCNAPMAPEVGFEPTTNRLTADRSTAELLRSVVGQNSSCEAR